MLAVPPIPAAVFAAHFGQTLSRMQQQHSAMNLYTIYIHLYTYVVYISERYGPKVVTDLINDERKCVVNLRQSLGPHAQIVESKEGTIAHDNLSSEPASARQPSKESREVSHPLYCVFSSAGLTLLHDEPSRLSPLQHPA